MARPTAVIEKETVALSTPGEFVRKAQQLLDEASQVKANIENCLDDSVYYSDRTREYYDLIDSSVKDQEVLEQLRVRRLVIESLKTADKETKEYVRKERSSNHDTRELGNEQSVSTTQPKTKDSFISQRVQAKMPSFARPKTEKCPRGLINAVSKTKPLLTPCSSGNIGGKAFFPRSPPVKRQSSYISKCEAPQRELKNKPLGPVILSHEFLCKAQDIFPTISTKLKTSDSKFIPCAIPLAPPSRKRKTELICDIVNTENVPPEKNAPVLIQQNKVSVINIDRVEKPRRNLITQILPGVNIIGQRPLPVVEEMTISAEPKYISISEKDAPEHQNTYDLDVQSTHSLPGIFEVRSQPALPCLRESSRTIRSTGKSDTRLDTLITGLARALRRWQDKVGEGSEIVSQSKLPENSSASSFPGNVQCSAFAQSKVLVDVGIDSSSLITLVDKHVQAISEPLVVQTANSSVATQAALLQVHTSTECEQIRSSFSSCSVYAQTELQGLTDSDIIIIKSKGDGISDKEEDDESKSPSSEILCHVPSTATLSTDENDGVFDVYKSSLDVIDNHRLIDAYSNTVVETLEVGTQAYSDKDCQTLPEMISKGIQVTLNNAISQSTMTDNIEPLSVATETTFSLPTSETKEVQPRNHNLHMNSVATQVDMLDTSASSTTLSNITNLSENDFADDLLSEEGNLPWNLRLLSLFDRSVGGQTRQSLEYVSERTQVNENMLSEGEIPQEQLRELRGNDSQSTLSTLYISASDTSLDLVPERLAPETSSDSQGMSSKSSQDDINSNQSAAAIFSKYVESSSDVLSSSGDRCLSEGEIVHSHESRTSQEEPYSASLWNKISTDAQIVSPYHFVQSSSTYGASALAANDQLEADIIGSGSGELPSSSDGDSSQDIFSKFCHEHTSREYANTSVAKSPDLLTVLEENSLEHSVQDPEDFLPDKEKSENISAFPEEENMAGDSQNILCSSVITAESPLSESR